MPGQSEPMQYTPSTGVRYPYPKFADEWRVLHKGVIWRFNPWEGNLRNQMDVDSDPYGYLIYYTSHKPQVKPETSQVTPKMDMRLKLVNDRLIDLEEQVKQRDKWLKEEQACSSELAVCAARERAERLSQERKSDISLMFMIFTMVFYSMIVVYPHLF